VGMQAGAKPQSSDLRLLKTRGMPFLRAASPSND
jgi:hypothetical protein